jgi:hypothetical protein
MEAARAASYASRMTTEHRRAPRLAAAARAELSDRFRSSPARLEDVSARGCRLATDRAPRPGALVQVTLSSHLLPDALRVAAQVVWAKDGRAGCAFLGAVDGGPRPADWMERLAHVIATQPAPPPEPRVPVTPAARAAPVSAAARVDAPGAPVARLRLGRAAG